MAADRIVARGFALFWPAMSGAEPWLGTYRPWLEAFMEAEGSMPMEAVSMAASSDRMSPNRLPVTMTSNALGARTSCMAALSTYMCESSTFGYSRATSMTMSRQNCEVSRTLALSTLHRRPWRLAAA